MPNVHPSGAHLFAISVRSWPILGEKNTKREPSVSPKKTTRSLSVVEGIVRDALVTNFWETTFATLWIILTVNIPGLPEEVGRTGLLSSTTDKNSNSTGRHLNHD